MRVLADSHAVYRYLTKPDELSARALRALGDAEDTEGIVVSVLTIPELWMAATRKRGARAVPRGGYELVRATLLDPHTAVVVEPLTSAMWHHFETLPADIADPTDGLIMATALALGVPLVTRDRRIAESAVVEVIW